MTIPKYIGDGGIVTAEDLTELQAVGSNESLEAGQIGWVESEERWYVARSVDGPDNSTWDAANGIADTYSTDAVLRDGSNAFTANQSMGSNRITDLAAPSLDNDAATKAYVDSVASGLTVKEPVVAATTASGDFGNDFDDGSVLDGVTLATGDRILLKDQTDASTNGIYTVAASGAPSRSSDADVDAEVTTGMLCFVGGGTVNGGSRWILNTPAPITVDTTDLTFVQFAAGEISGGESLTSTGVDVYTDTQNSKVRVRGIKGVGDVVAAVSGDGNDVEISLGSALGEINTATNLGSGSGVFAQKNGADFELRSMANTSGSGAGVVKGTTADAVEFRTIKAGANISVTENTDDVEIALAGVGVFGGEAATAESLSTTTHASTSWLRKVRLTTADVPAGTYIVVASYSRSGASFGTTTRVRLRQDETTDIYEERAWTTGLSNYEVASYTAPLVLASGVHTFDLELRSSTTGLSAGIKDARLAFYRVA